MLFCSQCRDDHKYQGFNDYNDDVDVDHNDDDIDNDSVDNDNDQGQEGTQNHYDGNDGIDDDDVVSLVTLINTRALLL